MFASKGFETIAFKLFMAFALEALRVNFYE